MLSQTIITGIDIVSLREIKLICDPKIPEIDVIWLRSFFETSMREGTEYSDGQLLQIGSNILRIRVSENTLQPEEPDLRSNPINFVPGVTNTLRMLRVQKDVYESFDLGDSPNFPDIRNSLIICTKLASGGFFMDRATSTGLDSGWFLGCLHQHEHNDPKELLRISVYQAIVNTPRIIPYLALPSGTKVVVNDSSIEMRINGKELVPKPGSYIDQKLKS